MYVFVNVLIVNKQAQPFFRDPKRFPDMADPFLNKCFPEKDLNQAVAMAAMCLQEEPAARPLISDVVVALSFLSVSPPEGMPVSLPAAPSQKSPPKESTVMERDSSDDDHSDSSSDEDNESQYSQEGKSKSSRKSSKKSESVRKSSNDGSAKPKGARSRLKSKGKSGKKGRKSSRKSSGSVLSHKSSMESDGNVSSGRSSEGSDDESDIYEGSGSSEGESVHSEHDSMPLDHSLSRGSEEESVDSE